MEISDNEKIGLDAVSETDAENVTTRNVATDLSSLTRGNIRPIIPKTNQQAEVINIDEILAAPDPIKPKPQEIVGLDKLTEQDLEHPETRYKTVDLAFFTPDAKKKSDVAEPTSPAIPTVGLSETVKQVEFQDMPYVTKSDIKDFSANTKVDTKVLTQQYCRGCNKPLTELEKSYFLNRCYDCQKVYFEKYKSDTRIRYIILAILLTALIIISSLNYPVGSTGILVSNLVGLVLVCGATFILTLTTLAKKVNTNMVPMDYMWICLFAIVLSYVFYAFFAIAYIILAGLYSIFSVVRDVKRIKAQKCKMLAFEKDTLQERLKVVHCEKTDNSLKTD